MIATSLLYLQSKSELAGMNTCGSCRCVFCYSVTKLVKNNLEELCAIKFCVELGEGATDAYEKILHHVPKYFGGTETLLMREKQWKTDRDVRASTDDDRVRAFIRQGRCFTIQ
jgi:hypothetical protein